MGDWGGGGGSRGGAHRKHGGEWGECTAHVPDTTAIIELIYVDRLSIQLLGWGVRGVRGGRRQRFSSLWGALRNARGEGVLQTILVSLVAPPPQTGKPDLSDGQMLSYL